MEIEFSRLKKWLSDPGNLILPAILLLAAMLRFWNFPFRNPMDGDQSRDMLVAISGARNWQLPLTGPFSSAGPFTFGPWYYWFLIVSRIIVNNNFAPWIFMGLASVAMVYFLYKAGEAFVDRKLGLIAAFFAAVSSWQVASGANMGNGLLVMPFAALTVWLFAKIINTKKPEGGLPFLFGLSLGITINMHYQALGLLPLWGLLFLAKLRDRRSLSFSLVGFFISFLPLLFFDLNNHWFTVRNVLDYYLIAQYRIYLPNRWLFYLRDFWPEAVATVFGINKVLAGVVIGSFFATTAYLIKSRQLTKTLTFLLIAFFLNFILLRYYRGERNVGYIFYLVPELYLFLALTVYGLWQNRRLKFLGLGLVILICFVNIPKLGSILQKPPGDIVLSEMQDLSKQKPGNKFEVYYCKQIYQVAAQKLAVYLEFNQLFGDTGTKVGYHKSDCLYPESSPHPTSEENSRLAEKFPAITSDLTDLSGASEKAILSAGWKPVTARDYYDLTVKWWYNEKP